MAGGNMETITSVIQSGRWSSNSRKRCRWSGTACLRAGPSYPMGPLGPGPGPPSLRGPQTAHAL